MSQDEAIGFLASGTRTGKLGVVRRDGSAIVQPIWFVVDDEGCLVFTTGADTTKGRALRRDPRVSIVVDEDAPPYAFVRMDGEATISREMEPMLHWATLIARRYMGDDLAESYGRRNAVPEEMLVRVRPTRIVARAGVAD